MIRFLKLSTIIGWIFGFFVLSIGILNIFRGNDPGLGIIYILLSVLFFPITNKLLKDLFGVTISYYVKALLAFLILWTILAARLLRDIILK